MKMDFDSGWDELMTEVRASMKAWRIAHPKATFKAMELELNARFAQAKARMLGDMAQASALADLSGTASSEERKCPQCGGKLRSKGKRKRRLTSEHDQPVELERSYLECATCGFKVFPPG